LSVLAWRIVKQKHAKDAFRGEGARRYGGRWNSKGTAVVYTAQSQSLAALEIMVHAEFPDLLEHYAAIPVTIEDGFIEKLDVATLPKDWRAYPASCAVRAIGDDWAASGTSVALKVPSVVIPSESNFLLNPAHRDFAKLKVGEATAFEFDPRFRGKG
jgi:RES domain-containing protein